MNKEESKEKDVKKEPIAKETGRPLYDEKKIKEMQERGEWPDY